MQEESHNILPNVKLREQRKKKNWTQAELAELIGVAELTVRRWERGQVVPSAYHAKKLCDLFIMTPKELGLVKVEAIKDEKELEVEMTKENKAEEEEYKGESNEKEESTPIVQLTQESKQANERIIEKSSLKRSKGYMPPRKIYIPLVGLVLLIILAGFYTGKILYLQPEQGSLYQANWSQGIDTKTWVGTANWEWQPEVGGMISTQAEVANGILTIPYQPDTSDYIVEVQMKRDGYAATDGRAYGLVVRMVDNQGYICGVGKHYLPEHFFAGRVSLSTTRPASYQIADSASQTASLDEGWHDYQVEVKGHEMMYTIDKKLVADINIPLVSSAGKIGIYVDHAAIEVRGLRVLTVST